MLLDAAPDLFERMSPEVFGEMWNTFQKRWSDRDDRMRTIDAVYRGEFDEFGPDDQALDNRSPNLVQVATDDMAGAAASVPTVRVTPSNGRAPQQAKARHMEKLGASYLTVSEYPVLATRSYMDLLLYGMYSWVVYGDEVDGPRIQRRDPRGCYPENDYGSLEGVGRCFFGTDVSFSELPAEYQQAIRDDSLRRGRAKQDSFSPNAKVTVVEYFAADRETVGLVYGGSEYQYGDGFRHPTRGVPVCVIVKDEPNVLGVCRVVIGKRPTPDGEPRGHFDQVVNILRTHVRLMALMLDAADQAVYSDLYVIDPIGEIVTGGVGYIQLGPQGKIGRVPPAVPGMSLFSELQMLLDNLHLGSRYPKARPGEVEQNIASSKFVESMMGTMNGVIKGMHQITKSSLERALRVCFKMEKWLPGDRSVSGVSRRQHFIIGRDDSDIDLAARPWIEYGLAFGRDQAQAAVLGIQLAQAGFLSQETVQENIEGVVDIELEKQRLDVEKLQAMLQAELLMKAQNGELPPRAIVEMIRQRTSGKTLEDLYEKYVLEPAEEAMAEQLTSGLTGEPVMPGAGPPVSGGPMPPAPPDILAMLGGGGVDTPSRLSMPAGNSRSFISTQTS